tara:strand:- start:2406 stop:2867 length:462 start_codon:yes stop_codon:yes gene_type:complete
MNNNPVPMEDQVPSSKQYVTPGQMPQENNYFTDPTGPRYQNPAEFDQAMYEQAMAAQTTQPQQPGVKFNVPDFEAMRKEALQQAIQQVTQTPAPPVQMQQPVSEEPKIVYVRRNLTLAEILVVFALASGIVLGVQGIWSFATDILPRIEIRDK